MDRGAFLRSISAVRLPMHAIGRRTRLVLAVAIVVPVAYLGQYLWKFEKTKRSTEDMLAKLTAEQLVEFEHWKTEPLHLPLEKWDRPAPSRDTLAAVEAFDRALLAVDPADREKWNNVRRLTPAQAKSKLKPEEVPPLPADVFDALGELVRRNEYRSYLLTPFGSGGPLNLRSLQQLAWAMRYHSMVLSDAGDCDGAFEIADSLLQLARVERYWFVIHQLIAIALADDGIEATEYAVERCPDADLIRQALDDQTTMAPQLRFLPDDVPLGRMEKISSLMRVERHGIDIELHASMTGAEVAIELSRAFC